MYQLLSSNPFHLPNNPGPQAVYYGPRTPIVDVDGNPVLGANGTQRYDPIPTLDHATQVTIDTSFVQEQNYRLLHLNIKEACYNMLDNSINDAFKFSPDPDLTRWNPSMEIKEILEQLLSTYGCPTPITLLQNDTLFCSVYSPWDAPEVLFHHIEDCQEIVGPLPKGYIRNILLPRVPVSQRTRIRQVQKIPAYYDGPV
jgi:hypothetical protein